MARAEPAGHTVIATQEIVAEAAALREDLRSYLVVVENDTAVGRFALGPEPLTIGRDPARDVVLPDAQVSRLHMQVYLADGNVIAEDLGSSNGTFLDGKRLSGPVILGDGQWLQVGSRLLKHERRSQREVERAAELDRELDKARSYVRSLLPAPVTSGPIRTDWFYQPSTQLGGDAFYYERLDEGHLSACLVDVSGHGVGPAMHSVSVLNMLRQHALPAAVLRDPAQVLHSLNTMYPMEQHDGLYFTIWYGVYSLADRELTYGTAGHHAGYLYAPGEPVAALRTRGLMIGAMPEVRYQAGSVHVLPGSTLYIFSDGVFEYTTPAGVQCGLDDFLPLLGDGTGPLEGVTERIYREVCARARPGPLDDDFSLLAVRFD